MAQAIPTFIEFRIYPGGQTMSYYFDNYIGVKDPRSILLFKVPLFNFRMDDEKAFVDMDQSVFLRELKKTWVKPDCFCGVINDFGKHFIPANINLFESID